MEKKSSRLMLLRKVDTKLSLDPSRSWGENSRVMIHFFGQQSRPTHKSPSLGEVSKDKLLGNGVLALYLKED